MRKKERQRGQRKRQTEREKGQNETKRDGEG